MSPDHFDMSGKTILITGGSKGIGKSFAIAFAEAGANVAICGRDELRMSEVSNEIRKLGRRALTIKADMRLKCDIDNVVNKTLSEFGYIDVLINNAGINLFKGFLDTTEDDWNQILDTDLKGVFFCSQAVARIMVERKEGNIINLASVAGIKARSPRAAYCTVKAGIIMLSRALAQELGRYNIRVNCIAPGTVFTDMSKPFFDDIEAVKDSIANTPLGRFGEPKDIVGSALFLASDASKWITGHTIVVDGGLLA
jgi:NAD(P)-dependent dehydrogenase (short-subunit alcohol dehydrogenase family)